ncbi:hypothetical protein NPIL_692471 [Nephila pilipes]|uniref:Uncharacterized protein n=1 Tax=Nephila pilipes TaxID=299642 RepID=A0A8X6SZC1_NEPPI|nr:hypothetical protein NPIL_692471 [Nephila pilipes]
MQITLTDHRWPPLENLLTKPEMNRHSRQRTENTYQHYSTVEQLERNWLDTPLPGLPTTPYYKNQKNCNQRYALGTTMQAYDSRLVGRSQRNDRLMLLSAKGVRDGQGKISHENEEINHL